MLLLAVAALATTSRSSASSEIPSLRRVEKTTSVISFASAGTSVFGGKASKFNKWALIAAVIELFRFSNVIYTRDLHCCRGRPLLLSIAGLQTDEGRCPVVLSANRFCWQEKCAETNAVSEHLQ